MEIPDALVFSFLFAFGCCVGSFLNVVIYRLPRDKSLVYPGSACPACGRSIRFYDNIPLVSWVALRARCRYCKAPISPRYVLVELLTGVLFVCLACAYFRWDMRSGIPGLLDRPFLGGAWLVYGAHVALLGALLAASAIDLELWIIPLGICWFATAVGVAASAGAGLWIDPVANRAAALMPQASPFTGALALGAGLGLAVSLVLLYTGLIRRSYEDDQGSGSQESPFNGPVGPPQDDPDRPINHRLEALREVVFLAPILVGAVGSVWITGITGRTWSDFVGHPVVSGVLGSLFGYFVGCAVVWLTRILGTLGFGKEAMGLGDVHLMGAVGAVLGAGPAIVAFFIAPFFGLTWALAWRVSKKIRQIPFGPHLSLGALTVMIFHDWIWSRLGVLSMCVQQ